MITEPTTAPPSNGSKVIKCAGYIRVSTDRQAEHGHSIPEQEESIRLFCQQTEVRNGVLCRRELVKLFIDEGVSAQTPLLKRPAGRELQLAITRGEVDCVVIRNVSRAFRSVLDAARVCEEWGKVEKIELRILDMPIDLGDKYGRFMLHILSAVNELDREIRNDRIREALCSARKRGVQVGKFKTNVGYKFDFSNAFEPKEVRHEETWKTMEWFYHLHHEEGWTIDAIYTMCQRKAIKRSVFCRKRSSIVNGRWAHRQVVKQEVWGYEGVKRAIQTIEAELAKKRGEV